MDVPAYVPPEEYERAIAAAPTRGEKLELFDAYARGMGWRGATRERHMRRLIGAPLSARRRPQSSGLALADLPPEVLGHIAGFAPVLSTVSRTFYHAAAETQAQAAWSWLQRAWATMPPRVDVRDESLFPPVINNLTGLFLAAASPDQAAQVLDDVRTGIGVINHRQYQWAVRRDVAPAQVWVVWVHHHDDGAGDTVFSFAWLWDQRVTGPTPRAVVVMLGRILAIPFPRTAKRN